MDEYSPSDAVRLVEPPHEEGADWLKASLSRGHALSAAVRAADPFDRGRLRSLVSDETPDSSITRFNIGGVIDSSRHGSANEALAKLLNDFIRQGAGCVVVEDDALGRCHPALGRVGAPSAYMGEDVIHWANLATPTRLAAVRAIWASASGFPTNAFVVRRSSEELGLVDGASAPAQIANNVVGALLAVIVSAYDAESFLIWDNAGL
jgi:hypothetical protein